MATAKMVKMATATTRRRKKDKPGAGLMSLEVRESKMSLPKRVIHLPGQIIPTSHDRFPPNGGLVREIPLFQGNLGW